MYSEQLAILLLVAANHLSTPVPVTGPAARLPEPFPSVQSVNLKLDPQLRAYRNPYTGKVVQRWASPKPALLASAQ
jgi:hypothetical protein